MLCHPKASVGIGNFTNVLLFSMSDIKLGYFGYGLITLNYSVRYNIYLSATVGVVNAFNLIDGLNGLSSYITISTALPFLLFHSRLKIFNSNFSYIIIFFCAWFFCQFPLKNFPWRWVLYFGSPSGLECTIAYKRSDKISTFQYF